MPFDIESARSLADRTELADPTRLRDDIAALAQPRMTGSPGAAAVEKTLRDRFEGMGFRTRELGFSFSTWPGRFGLSVAGILVAATGGLGGWLLSAQHPFIALTVLLAGLGMSLLPLLLLEPAMTLPVGRTGTSNLLFTRGDRPAWIVMAHRDSKSQLVSTLLRSVALALAAMGWLALFFLAVLWILTGTGWPPAAGPAAAVVVIAGGTLALSWSANGSPGALDNASGLAAMLEVARRMEGGEVAFLVTDGEELGLAGARAVARRLPPVQGVINLDGLDDRGRIRVAEGHGWRRSGTAPQLAAALLAAADALEVDAHRRSLPPTIQVDHGPIAAAGVPAVTVLRGGWRSLLRVHRRADDAHRLDGTGAARTATVLTVALRLLRDAEESRLAGGRGVGP